MLFFFDDETMHKIYVDEGKYNFLYRLPNLLYSTIISIIVGTILEYLALSENSIIEIKKSNNDNQRNIKLKVKKIKKCLKIKFILFYFLDFLFLLLFWYYISCFGVVYKNTQSHVLKDTLITFIFSLLYPIVQCLLPGIFRIPSLRASKHNKECIYKLSQFMENASFCLGDC